MHFVFFYVKLVVFLLQHAIEINIGDNFFNSFVFVDDL